MSTVYGNMGLTAWTSGTDFFNHTQLANNFQTIDNHDHSSGKGLQIPTGGLQNLAVTSGKIAANAVDASKILDGSVASAELASDSVITSKILNANVTTAKIADANVTAIKLADVVRLGLSDGTVVRRGSLTITGEESRSSTSYGLMPTADRIQNIALATDGVIFVSYNALWKGPGVNQRAAIFLGVNQIQVRDLGNGSVSTQAAAHDPTLNPTNYEALTSGPFGLISSANGGSDVPANVTTGQVLGAVPGAASNVHAMEFGGSVFNDLPQAYRIGGVTPIFAAAGTYDISIQYKTITSAANIFTKNRTLRVWTMSFN